ncbi:hypothetical protein VmeM32_00215 [Vibrio phage vB_VmeM-32]|nr:hypothetical protein VmeM32_00215 [Vibrio phage vB_VmeM-32]
MTHKNRENLIKKLLETTTKTHREIANYIGCSASVVSRVRNSYDCVRDKKPVKVHNISAPKSKTNTKTKIKPKPKKEKVLNLDVVYNWVLTAQNVTIVGNDMSQYTADKSHKRFEEIRDLIIAGKVKEAIEIIDTKEAVVRWSDGRIEIDGYELKLDGVVIKNKLAERIIAEAQKPDSGDVQRYVNFMKKLDENPNPEMFDDLFDFIVHADIEIADDGDVIAYKRVREDGYDFYTGTILNAIGTPVKMKRRDCDPDRNRTCSGGLHVCAKSYLKHYQNGRGVILKVKVNPKNFVAIPRDYNFTKARVCEYVPTRYEV